MHELESRTISQTVWKGTLFNCGIHYLGKLYKRNNRAEYETVGVEHDLQCEVPAEQKLFCRGGGGVENN